MEIVDDYEKLCQKIWVMRNNFYRQYHIEPNIMNVGYDEFYLLENGNQFLIENVPKNEKDYTCFGMKLKRVMEDNHLSVGFVIE